MAYSVKNLIARLSVLAAALATCLLAPGTRAATITAASPSQSDVAAAVASAVAGDTVQVPAGTATWSGAVRLSKPITVMGAPNKATRLINATASASVGLETAIFDINLTSDGPVRITGFYFQDEGLDHNSDAIDTGYGSVHETKLHIDNCTFEGFSYANKIHGAFGVCHDCYFLNNLQAGTVAGYHDSSYLSGMTPPPWAWDSMNYFVWEDCLFELSNWGRDTYMIDTEYPANYIVRYCTFNINRSAAVVADGFDMHGNITGSLDALGLVIYKNTFNYTGNNTVNPVRLVDIRGGVGSMVYSNTVNGVDTYASLRDDPFTAPLMSRTYLWNNVGAGGKPMSIGTSDGVTAGVNFFTSPPSDFKQLAYPHPLRGPITNPVIALSPGSLDFGLVPVGSTNNLTITVRNGGAGTLTGTASIASPFRIMSGANYSLGSNASQPVVVRYTPTTAGTHSQMLTFTGAGGATATVSGSAWSVQSGLTFSATNGVISGPFTINADRTISESVDVDDPTLGGRAVYGFSIANPGEYTVVGEVYIPAADSDSFFVNIDAEPTSPDMIWDVPVYAGFTNRVASWRLLGGAPKIWTLNTGTHQLVICGREPGAKLRTVTISPATQLAKPAIPADFRFLTP